MRYGLVSIVKIPIMKVSITLGLLVLILSPFDDAQAGWQTVLIGSAGYGRYTDRLGGYEGDMVAIAGPLLVGSRLKSLGRRDVEDLSHSARCFYTGLGGNVFRNIKLMAGVAWYSLETNLPGFLAAEKIWQAEDAAYRNGAQPILAVYGYHTLDTAWEPGSRIYGLMIVGMGRFDENDPYFLDVHMLTGIPLLRGLCLTASVWLNWSMDQESDAWGLMGIGFGIGYSR